MIHNYLIKNKTLIVCLLISCIIFSLIIGLIFNEDLSTGGARKDFFDTYLAVIDYAKFNFKFHEHTRHFPLHYLILSIPHYFFDNILVTRIAYFFFSFLAPVFLYLNLNILYPDNKYKNFLISFSILLLPYYRSSAIWANAHLTALIFLLISNFFFLNFKKSNNRKFKYLNILFLSFATYSMQSYVIFFIYYLYEYFKSFNLKNIAEIIFFCFVLSLPGMYLVYSTPLGGKLDFTNSFGYTILTNSSIIFFFLLFFIINKSSGTLYVNMIKKLRLKEYLLITIFYLLLIFNFETPFTIVCGGFFYKLSYFIFEKKYLFYLIGYFSIISIFLIFKIDKKIFYSLLLVNFTAVGYITSQKYFEPLLLIVIFISFKNILVSNLISKKSNILIFYLIIFLYFLAAQLNEYLGFSLNLQIV